MFVGRRPYTLVVFFCKGLCLCASAVFVRFEVLVVLRNQDPSIAAEMMGHWTRTNILYPLALHHMLFLPPHVAMPTVDPSMLTVHAHIPHWRGEAMWWSLRMWCWQPLKLEEWRKGIYLLRCELSMMRPSMINKNGKDHVMDAVRLELCFE